MNWTPEADSALLVIDVQRDFCPGGSLAVVGGDAVVAPLNSAAQRWADADRLVVATRDWHPARTVHFQAYGGTWPPHCVQGTPGAEFHPDLKLPREAQIISKADKRDEDSYSAFGGTDLAKRLRQAGVRRVWIGGCRAPNRRAAGCAAVDGGPRVSVRLGNHRWEIATEGSVAKISAMSVPQTK